MKFLAFIVLLLAGLFTYKLYFSKNEAHEGYKLEWTVSKESPALFSGWSWTTRPLFDTEGNIYFCAGYAWDNDISIFKINPAGKKIWELETNTACNHIEIFGDKLFVWFQDKNSVEVIRLSDKEVLKSFSGFKRLAKTDQWIYSISSKGITRIDPQTLAVKVFDSNPKSFVARKDNLLFVIENQIFSISDKSEKVNQEIVLDRVYNNYRLFLTDNFICVPFEAGSPDTTGSTICYDLRVRGKEKIEIEGYNHPLDSNIVQSDKILLKNIVRDYPKSGFSEYDLANEDYTHLGGYKDMAYDQKNLYHYDSRDLRKFVNNSFPKIFSASGYIRYVRQNKEILYVTTDMGQLHAISKLEN